MSDAVATAPRGAKLDLGGFWIVPPLLVIALFAFDASTIQTSIRWS